MIRYSESRRKGALYEQFACDVLEKNGYDILDRNFTVKSGEIDIIALQRGQICFIEVKALRQTVPFDPEESVTPLKLKKITETSLKYMYRLHRTSGVDISQLKYRYDVIAIRFDDNGDVTKMTHFRNCYSPDKEYMRQMLEL